MIKKINLKLTVAALAIIFASFYLTFIVDVHTLNTWLKRIFVLAYFLIAATLAVKCSVLLKLNKFKIVSLVSLLGAIVTLIFGQGAFLPIKNEHTFYLQSTSSSETEEEYGKVVIGAVEVDGEEISFAKIDVEMTGIWSYDEENAKFIFAPEGTEEETDETTPTEPNAPIEDDTQNESEPKEPDDFDLKKNLIAFTVFGDSVKFTFESGKHGGVVRIYDDSEEFAKLPLNDESNEEDEAVTIDVTESDGENGKIEYTVQFGKTYSILERIIYNVGAVITMTFVYKIFLELLIRFVNKNAKKKSNV